MWYLVDCELKIRLEDLVHVESAAIGHVNGLPVELSRGGTSRARVLSLIYIGGSISIYRTITRRTFITNLRFNYCNKISTMYPQQYIKTRMFVKEGFHVIW